MNTYIIPALMGVLSSAAAISMWHSIHAVNAMSWETDHGVRWGYVLKATGYFVQILAVGDYLHGDPMAWPWLLLAGIALCNSGTALLHVSAKRICHCPECPIRWQKVETRSCQ